MIQKTLITLVSVFGVARAQIQNPGLTASLDIAVIQQAKNVYFDKILNIIRSTSIPDFSFDSGYVKGNTFAITEDSKNVNLYADAAQNAFVFSVADLAGEFKSSSFKFKEYFLAATGSVDVKMKNVSVTVGLQMISQPGSEGRLLPAIAAADVSVKVDKNGLDIKLSGNYLTTMASWFEWFFKGTICDEVEKTLTDKIKNEMPQFLNNLIKKSDGYATPVPFEKMTEFITVDWSGSSPVLITATSIEAGINGFVFDNRYPKTPVQGITSVSMPVHDNQQPQQVQAYANSYFVNNLFAEILTENQDFALTLDETNTSFNMTTSSLNYALLGIKKHYGADVPVTIDIKIKAVEDFHVKEADATMQALSTVDVKFFVHTVEKTELAV